MVMLAVFESTPVTVWSYTYKYIFRFPSFTDFMKKPNLF